MICVRLFASRLLMPGVVRLSNMTMLALDVALDCNCIHIQAHFRFSVITGHCAYYRVRAEVTVSITFFLRAIFMFGAWRWSLGVCKTPCPRAFNFTFGILISTSSLLMEFFNLFFVLDGTAPAMVDRFLIVCLIFDHCISTTSHFRTWNIPARSLLNQGLC